MLKLRAGASAVLLLMPSLCLAIPEGPAANTPEWAQREATNFAKVLEAPREQVSNPAFMQRLSQQSADNINSYTMRDLADPSWFLASSPILNALIASGMAPAEAQARLTDAFTRIQADPMAALQVPLNTPLTPLCGSWALQCVGDPFRYAGTDPFYSAEAEVTPIVFYDEGCARLSGRVWAPKGSHAGSGLPAVVIENGSVQAPETLYWWMAQLLVRNGYVVMTFDPRGQGRSDQQTPTGTQGSNSNPSVFWTGLVNAIDFFRSTPMRPYPHNKTCAGTYPTVVTDSNPYSNRVDYNRLGIAGHSLGAKGVSIVQGYGGSGADPWPGKLDSSNPVKVAVAWDGLAAPGGGAVGGAGGNLPGAGQLTGALTGGSSEPKYVARVPAMGHSSEYGLTPTPFTQAPDVEGHKAAYTAWRKAGVPVYEITIQGSSHYEWSLIPTFPTTSWCADTSKNHCEGGWGNPLAQHYSLAWMDRWLKQPGEAGYDTADARLLADADWVKRYSFYYRSARSFPTRSGQAQSCEDIRAGCGNTATAGNESSSGGALPLSFLWVLLGAAVLRKGRANPQSSRPASI
jgi:hypothetical protein